MDWEKIEAERYRKHVKPYTDARREVEWINGLNLCLDGGVVRTREYQEEFILQTYLGKHVVIYKPRQAGYTTIFLLHMFYTIDNEFAMCNGKCHSNYLYAAPNGQMCEEARNLLKRIILSTVTVNRKDYFQEIIKHVSFIPYSQIDKLCGRRFDYEFYDEFAQANNLIDFTTCAFPCLIHDNPHEKGKDWTNPPKGTAVFASSFNDRNINKAKQDIWNFLNQGKDNDTAHIVTHWYEVPYYNKYLVWAKYKAEPTIDAEGNVKYDKERWEKMIDDGWVPTSPRYESLSKMMLGSQIESELLN